MTAVKDYIFGIICHIGSRNATVQICHPVFHKTYCSIENIWEEQVNFIIACIKEFLPVVSTFFLGKILQSLVKEGAIMDNNNVNLQGIADDVYKLFPFFLLPRKFFDILLKSVLTLIFVK